MLKNKEEKCHAEKYSCRVKSGNKVYTTEQTPN